MKYDIVTQSQESTVVAKYDSNNKKESAYQTEAALEKAFIELSLIHISEPTRPY